MKKVFFRVDFGSGIGLGHLFRSLKIAQACKQIGMKVIFLSRQHIGSDPDLFSDFEHLFIGPGKNCQPNDSKNWLGVSVEEDAADTLAHLSPHSIVYVDHYSIDKDWHLKLRKQGHFVISMDDHVIKSHGSDALLDYNISAKPEDYNFSGQLLLGPSYFPFSDVLPERSTPTEMRSVVISLGSCDISLLEKVLGALAKSHSVNPEAMVTVVHSQKPHNLGLFKHTEYRSFDPEMVKLFSQSDLAIGSAGVAFLERVLTKTPQIVFKVADNQHSNAEFIEKNWNRSYGGDLREKDIDGSAVFASLKLLPLKSFVITIPHLSRDGAFRVAHYLSKITFQN